MKAFTLDEARGVLGVLRTLAPDELRLPLSRRDLAMVLGAGVDVKSSQHGLLDFPTLIEGREAYWCWQSGEREIEWWHPRSDGFAGRRSIEG